MNEFYVGGHFQRGAFKEFYGTPGTAYWNSSDNNARVKGRWYVASLSDARNSSRISVFLSARGTDIGGAFGSTPVQGYHEVCAPSIQSGFTSGGVQTLEWTTWTAKRRWDPTRAPGDYGNVDLRYIDNQGISAYADGHVSGVKVDDIYDMRMWTDHADTANWRWENATTRKFFY
jgi:hypothetical protein